jgi:CheY-like chemotaxis protein
MFHLLLVEDQLRTRDELYELLREDFPDAWIETASTVTDGSQKISSAAASRQPFDIAVLDFKLPIRQGENPEINESLCAEIKSQMPQTLVIHITSFNEDLAVNEHIARYHSSKSPLRMELINKTDARIMNWTERLIREIKSFLISRQIGELFDPSIEPAVARGEAIAGRRWKHKLEALRRDIAAYWKDLDGETKEQVNRHFLTQEYQQQIRVTLRLPE